jgi:hypothetical protein
LIETCGADPRSSEFATHLGETHAAGIHRSRRRVAAEKSTLRPDDLQSLPGIGPAIDKQLRSIEIASVPQLRAVIELAKATAGVTTMQWLRQNLTAHPVSDYNHSNASEHKTTMAAKLRIAMLRTQSTNFACAMRLTIQFQCCVFATRALWREFVMESIELTYSQFPQMELWQAILPYSPVLP